jgi:hypothetical protein
LPCAILAIAKRKDIEAVKNLFIGIKRPVFNK